MPGSEQSFLTLGWRTTQALEPAYWAEGPAIPGSCGTADLVQIPASTMAAHTAIIAQSGSGKSFLLGRLVEEIFTQTRARCVILDPNADFRRVHEVEEPSLWHAPTYDRQRRRGRLTHEKTRSAFSARWTKRHMCIRTQTIAAAAAPYETLQVSWPALSMDVIAEDIDPMLRSDLYHCHSFLNDLASLHRFKTALPTKTRELIDEAEQLLRQARNSEADFRTSLQLKYSIEDILSLQPKSGPPPFVRILFWGTAPPEVLRSQKLMAVLRSEARARVTSLIESLVRTPKYISQTVEHFYFSKARSYETAGVITPTLPLGQSDIQPEKRLDVIDLPSLKDKATRLLAISAIMNSEWTRVRRNWATALRRPANRDTRAPTFLVIDEAHNLIPAEPHTKAETAVRDIFRTVVAEGRKYGLFVILVSQRPDKLDPLVLSECENKAIMKLSSGAVLDITRKLLGLDDVHPKMLEKCLDFDLGRALLVGRWAPSGPQFMYAAARRTVEGGRNLRDEYWTLPPSSPRQLGTTDDSRPRTKRARAKRRKSHARAAHGGR